MDKKRILIADDEEVVRILLPEALKPYDYEIDVAKNGIEAIGHIDKKSYDLIITDYAMPEMDGLELTQWIKAKYPYTPILIITAHGPVRDLLKCGATACLMKPFDVFEIQNMVKALLGQ